MEPPHPSPPCALNAAVEAATRARDLVGGYRALLTAARVHDITPAVWADVPYTDKSTVFGADGPPWVAGRLADGAEVVCSSGQSGPPVSVGLSSHADQDAMRDRVDRILEGLGAGPDSTTLLVNVLPMGIAVPTSIATTATPSVHMEMALEVLTRIAPQFDRAVLVGEPAFLTELARRWAERGPVHPDLWVVTGGEPVAESWRAYLSRVLGVDSMRILVSMGVAEVGVHIFSEIPQLAHAHRVARGLTPSDRPWAGRVDRDDTPRLFTYDPAQLFVETRTHGDAPPTLVVTTLGERLIPLVRYDLGDIGVVLDSGEVAQLAALSGVDLPEHIVAVFGRGAHVRGPAGSLYPEQVRERLFEVEGFASTVTGRFRLVPRGDALECHVQMRGDTPGEPSSDDETLASFLSAAFGAPASVHRHGVDRYPFHASRDWTHKPRYVGAHND